METKKVKIEWNGEDQEVEIKKLTFGELGDIRKLAVKTRIIGTNVQREIDEKIMQEMSVQKAIVKAPFETDIGSIRNLPGDVGTLIYNEINALNSVDIKKKEDSTGPSGTEQPTQS